MRRIGFTIVEILLALMIIGVVASLTMPSLVTNYKNESYAKALSVAVSNFEKGMSAMIMQEGASDIFETEAWRTTSSSGLNDNSYISFATCLLKTMEVEALGKVSNYYSGTIKQINGSSASTFKDKYGSYYVYTFNQGPVYLINRVDDFADNNGITDEDALELGGNLTISASNVIIDVNGNNPPNKIGRDIFFFLLGSEGRLYPYGGIDYYAYNDNESYTWRDAGERYACTNETKGSWGEGCTARLIENDYKIDY